MISYQQFTLLCGFLTVILSVLYSFARSRKRNMEYYVTIYSAGLLLSVGVGLSIMVASYEGMATPFIVSFEEIKIYLPIITIVCAYSFWNIITQSRD